MGEWQVADVGRNTTNCFYRHYNMTFASTYLSCVMTMRQPSDYAFLIFIVPETTTQVWP